ncbi:MAG TPA: glycine cleavage T C-terminal barrel domain-containing protein, partial [Verrucomicrobiae bacterium]|nr:glycine cleavage T C-terminal barrel domain-containing protein [Verrucomicrobiae bacterium]
MMLHDFHESLGARFTTLGGTEAAADYGDPLAECSALREHAGMLDLGFRGRLCLTGNDRIRFLHGQVTNDIKRLSVGEGCYAALVTAKGRLESDLNVYRLEDEILLDFEPGLTEPVTKRLEKYIVADDVQIVDVGALYGLLTVQGPAAAETVRDLGFTPEAPTLLFRFVKICDPTLGELYVVNRPRLGTDGFDLFVPSDALAAMAERLLRSTRSHNGTVCGWSAFELARIEAGVPRFGADMDETNFPQECGIEASAVSYTKGCYIGQEVLNRIHTMGHVNRELVGLQISGDATTLPAKGDKLFQQGKEVGFVTSAVHSPSFANIALGQVRREAGKAG